MKILPNIILFEICTFEPRPSKCTEIVGGWGFAPDPTGGAYSAPPDPLAGLRGPTSKGPTSKGRGGEGILLRNSFRGLVTPLMRLFIRVYISILPVATSARPHFTPGLISK